METGYWGPVTATFDWCETNYAVSHFVAEFFNTISNLVGVFSGVMALRACYKAGLESRLWFLSAMALTVFIGSMCGHGTLLYEMQLTDELPMVYFAAAYAYCVFEDGVQRKYGSKFAFGLFFYCVIITIECVTIKSPLVHEIAFAIPLTLAIYRTGMWSFAASLSPSEGRLRRRLFFGALSAFVIGFSAWQVDVHACEFLQGARLAVYQALAPVLQLHAWWHIGSGIALHLAIVQVAHVRLQTLGHPGGVKLVGGVFPVLSPTMNVSDSQNRGHLREKKHQKVSRQSKTTGQDRILADARARSTAYAGRATRAV
eukprot:TRINITY_DN13656_c0_g1_i1.p1 TRINITY_DN13656_c0_g1~~TRINITY_DN13656_c0_g1_i1.p1  ORF type:complete len:332 (-),score=42.83 TRINITY_DN13656_c0_g1_i1:181-1122(-)